MGTLLLQSLVLTLALFMLPGGGKGCDGGEPLGGSQDPGLSLWILEELELL